MKEYEFVDVFLKPPDHPPETFISFSKQHGGTVATQRMKFQLCPIYARQSLGLVTELGGPLFISQMI